MTIFTLDQVLKKQQATPKDVVSLGMISAPAPEQVPEEKSGLVEFGKGVAKGVASTAQSLQEMGQKTIAGVDPTKTYEQIKDTTGIPALKKDFSASNNYQLAGKATESIGEFLLPFLKTKGASTLLSKSLAGSKGALGKTISAIKSAPTTETASKIAKTIMGETDTQIVKSGQNPMTQLFRGGGKKVSDVVSTVESSIDSFVNNSKSELRMVKDAIPDIQVEAREIAQNINDGIMNSIQHTADYRGIKNGFESAEDIISSGILKPEESRRIQDLVKFVSNWKDNSARGVLNLKESLSNFYATGENYTGSNAMVRSIQRKLVDLVGNTAPEIKPALKRASQNIDKTEEFMTHLIGKDAVTGESKVLSLARNLQDKAKNGYKVDLVRELEKITGQDIMPELEGVFDYLQSTKLKFPGLQSPVESAKFFVKKAIEKKIPLK